MTREKPYSPLEFERVAALDCEYRQLKTFTNLISPA